MSHTLTYIIGIILLIPGILMAFVPFLPALTYMFVIALVFGIVNGFTTLSGGELLVLLCITGVSIISDHTSGLLGAKYGGAHTKSLLWGFLGALLGLFIFPGPGSLIGLFLGILIAELAYKKHHKAALKAASGALMGSVAAVIINIILSIIFFVCFIFFALA